MGCVTSSLLGSGRMRMERSADELAVSRTLTGEEWSLVAGRPGSLSCRVSRIRRRLRPCDTSGHKGPRDNEGDPRRRTTMPYVRRLDHVGVVVEDLEAATEFFLDLGLDREGTATVEGEWVDNVVGLNDVRSTIVMMQTPD